MSENRLQFIFINGKGSSGKDTQADLILNEFGEKAIRISTGDIYREARAGTGKFGEYHDEVAPFVHYVDFAGGYLPDDLIVRIVKEEVLKEMAFGKEVFIFTGFPRTEGQLMEVDKMLAELGQNCRILEQHIYYSLSDESVGGRAEHRRDSARMYGEPTRADDEPPVVKRRLKVFRELTEPMIERLKSEGRLIEIDAEKTIEDIRIETSTRISKERE